MSEAVKYAVKWGRKVRMDGRVCVDCGKAFETHSWSPQQRCLLCSRKHHYNSVLKTHQFQPRAIGWYGGQHSQMTLREFRVRFWLSVTRRFSQKPGCWEWMRGNGRRYGKIALEASLQKRLCLPRFAQATRDAWRLTHGVIPKGLYLCHHCDNPRCVKPSHLFLGTAKENAVDMVRKGRGRRALESSNV